MIITIIPIKATEPLIRLILPRKEEYASLIDEPTIGIIEPIRNLIPLMDKLSADADKTLLIERNPVNNEAANPKTILNILLTEDVMRLIFMLSLNENEMPRQ